MILVNRLSGFDVVDGVKCHVQNVTFKHLNVTILVNTCQNHSVLKKLELTRPTLNVDRSDGFKTLLGLKCHVFRLNKMFTYYVRNRKNFHFPPARCVSLVVGLSFLHDLFSLSLSLSPAPHQAPRHIMTSDEEGSEYLSDGGDAVASRQRKHARDGRDSLQKMAKASKQAKVLLSPNPNPYPLSIPYPYPYPLSIAKQR